MSAILKVENLSHRYSSNWAIREINLEIASTGVIGLLGSNGAGKSTAMNIICGVLNQTEGAVYIDGIDIRKYPELAKRNIGFLPQTPPLYSDFTVDEYLIYASELRFIEKNKIRAAVEEVKERTGITHFSSRLINNLSGGYKQRVGIAQAIIHKPRLVVMDEPTNGLDPNQIIEARKLIKEIGRDHTVLLSSHILSEIQLLCKEIVMIESGRIVFSDSMAAFNDYIQPASLLLGMENPPPIADLQQVRGVTKVEYLTEKKARIHFEGDLEITELLIETGVRNGWKIREVNYDKNLLDDIFKHLSTQSK